VLRQLSLRDAVGCCCCNIGCVSVCQECCLAAVTLCAAASGLGCLYPSRAVLGLYRIAISQPVVVAMCPDPRSLHSMGFLTIKVSGTAQNV
jgi:hypothetical protein